MNELNYIARRIRRLMEERGISYRKLAKETGLSPRTIYLTLTSPKDRTVKTLQKIAEVLRVPLYALFIPTIDPCSQVSEEDGKGAVEIFKEVKLTREQLAEFFGNGMFIVDSYDFCAEASWGVSRKNDKDTFEFYDTPSGNLMIQGFLVKLNSQIKVFHQHNDTDFSPHYEEIGVMEMVESIWKVDIEIPVEVDILDPSCSGAYSGVTYHASHASSNSSCKLTPIWVRGNGNGNRKLSVLEYKGNGSEILDILEEILVKGTVRSSRVYSESIEELESLLLRIERNHECF